MFQKSNLAVILTYRFNPNRNPNVAPLCAKAWASLNPGAVYFVDGSLEKTTLPEMENLHMIHVPYEGNFNLSFMRNVGARAACDAGYKYIQIMDCDIFPSNPKFLEAALGYLRSQNKDSLRPLVINAPHEIQSFEKTFDSSYQDFLNFDHDKSPRKSYSYSIMLHKSSILYALNGFDEAYQVWGAEDDDFLLRLKRAGFMSSCLPGHKLIHSAHDNDTVRLAKDATDQYQKNLTRFRRAQAGEMPLKRMSDDWGLHPVPRPEASVK